MQRWQHPSLGVEGHRAGQVPGRGAPTCWALPSRALPSPGRPAHSSGAGLHELSLRSRASWLPRGLTGVGLHEEVGEGKAGRRGLSLEATGCQFTCSWPKLLSGVFSRLPEPRVHLAPPGSEPATVSPFSPRLLHLPPLISYNPACTSVNSLSFSSMTYLGCTFCLLPGGWAVFPRARDKGRGQEILTNGGGVWQSATSVCWAATQKARTCDTGMGWGMGGDGWGGIFFKGLFKNFLA